MGRPVVIITAMALLLMPSSALAEPASTTEAITRAPAPAAKRYIATIAVDGYSKAPPLRGAVADAKALTSAFQDRLGFQVRAKGKALSLLDAGVTAAGLDDFLHESGGPLAQVPDDALLVVYVALHGERARCGPKGGEACGEVLLQDSRPGRGFRVQDLLTRLDALPVRHVLLLLDTCDSGMALGGHPLERIDYDTLLDPASNRRSRKVITAAALDEPADDGDAATDRRGRFAATLLAGLTGEADLFPDGNLLFVELAIYLQTEVTRRSLADGRTGQRRQQPEFGGFLTDGQGSPSLGPLAPAGGTAERDADALLDRAKWHLEAGEPHRAQGVLARYLLALRHRAWSPYRVVGEARALAADGEHAAAIARIDDLRRSRPIHAAQDAALAQYQARLAREAGDTTNAQRRIASPTCILTGSGRTGI